MKIMLYMRAQAEKEPCSMRYRPLRRFIPGTPLRQDGDKGPPAWERGFFRHNPRETPLCPLEESEKFAKAPAANFEGVLHDDEQRHGRDQPGHADPPATA
jgi:hypothetical protein